MAVSVERGFAPFRFRFLEPLRRQLSGFRAWWAGELLELLPPQLRKALAGRRRKLYVEVHGDALSLALGDDLPTRESLRLPLSGEGDQSAEVPRDVLATLALVDADQVLHKRLTLPLAAEENLGEVLGFEMDLHTPFPAAEVYYDYIVVGRDTRGRKLTVDLVYSPRAAVEDVLDKLAACGLRADVVSSRRRDNGALLDVNLLPAEQRRSRAFNVRSLNLALSACLVVLLAAAIIIPIAEKDRAVAKLDAQVSAAAAAAREGSELRKELATMAAASQFLVQKRQNDTLTVELIDELSRILPDHTWVARLDLSASSLQLQGQSGASSTLIKIIESSPHFENAAFRSPVVQVPGSDMERFFITADRVAGEATP